MTAVSRIVLTFDWGTFGWVVLYVTAFGFVWGFTKAAGTDVGKWYDRRREARQKERKVRQ